MTPTSNTPVIGYVRVSTEEQGDSGLGLEAQEATIRSACAHRGWDLLAVHSEVASAKTTMRRPILHEALASLDAKGGPEAIVVAKLDRLTRSVADGGRLFERAKAKGWGIVALDLGVDTTTAAGELVANVMVAVGQWERKVIGERTSAALRAKVARGEPVGRPRTMPDTTIARLQSLRADGMSYRAIADVLNAEGISGSQGGAWFKQSVALACKRYGVKGENARPGGRPLKANPPVPAEELMDTAADVLLARHDEFLNHASRAIRDSWKPASTGVGAMRGIHTDGRHRQDLAAEDTRDYSYNGGNENSWHYREDGTGRKRLADYREDYITWARGADRDSIAIPGAPEPPEGLVEDLDTADDLRIRASANRRIALILTASDDDWRFDDRDRALALEEREQSASVTPAIVATCKAIIEGSK